MQNNNAPFKPIMQSQWNFISIELIQIAGSDLRSDHGYFSESRNILWLSTLSEGRKARKLENSCFFQAPGMKNISRKATLHGKSSK